MPCIVEEPIVTDSEYSDASQELGLSEASPTEEVRYHEVEDKDSDNYDCEKINHDHNEFVKGIIISPTIAHNDLKSEVTDTNESSLPEIKKGNDNSKEHASCEDDLTDVGNQQEDYELLRKRNIQEKEKILSQIFNGMPIDQYKKPLDRSPKKRKTENKKFSPRYPTLPRKHLPRRKASKAASERLTVDYGEDEDGDVVNLSEEDEEIIVNGKRRKLVIAIKPRKIRNQASLEPRIILSADEITEADLKNVADIVTEKVYTQSGTTCHQCRQKTNDMKTICRSESCTGVRGYFCGPCLRNRYGEDARVALKDPEWKCPPCKGICNCSICRNRAGARATGILTPIAKRFGYSSVKDYLNDHDKFVIKYEDE